MIQTCENHDMESDCCDSCGMWASDTHATPTSISDDTENTCIYCAKLITLSNTYHTWFHYVNGGLYFKCRSTERDAS